MKVDETEGKGGSKEEMNEELDDVMEKVKTLKSDSAAHPLKTGYFKLTEIIDSDNIKPKRH